MVLEMGSIIKYGVFLFLGKSDSPLTGLQWFLVDELPNTTKDHLECSRAFQKLLSAVCQALCSALFLHHFVSPCNI